MKIAGLLETRPWGSCGQVSRHAFLFFVPLAPVSSCHPLTSEDKISTKAEWTLRVTSVDLVQTRRVSTEIDLS
uniref:Secreted protein n=1 Tax=Setaria digitata TaxID=48799 RepID=A0A915PJ84_9BILA